MSEVSTREPSLLLIIAILVFIVIAEGSAQYCVKKCKVHQKLHFFLLAVFFYSLVCFGLYNMYSFREMGMVNLMWSCLSIVNIITIGVIFFHESLTRWDILGVIFVFIGFGLVFLKGHK